MDSSISPSQCRTFYTFLKEIAYPERDSINTFIFLTVCLLFQVVFFGFSIRKLDVTFSIQILITKLLTQSCMQKLAVTDAITDAKG